MLATLTIQNYALIQELNIGFSKGLSIITGETGAGKSILLGALSLLIGQRADTNVLYDSSRKCIVEGTFRLKNYGLEEFFLQNDLVYDENTVIRREISPDGKSRAFVNDSPVVLSILKDLGENLIDIHSQHQNLYLENPSFQIKVLDTFAKQSDQLIQYQEYYKRYQDLKKEFDKITSEAEKLKADQEYYQYQFNQLSQAKLLPNEQTELEYEQQSLTHSEEIKSALTAATDILTGEGLTVLPMLKEVQNHLIKLQPFFPQAESLNERLSPVLTELKDIAQETSRLAEKTEHDPDRITFVNQRLDLIYSLHQKHRVGNIQELIGIRDELQKKLEHISGSNDQLMELKISIDKSKAQLENSAEIISANRKKIIPLIEEQVQQILSQLGMTHGVFKVDLTSDPNYTISGKDRIQFLFSASKQGQLQPLGKIASGGEMARLMLSLKSIISEAVALPTIIFDEIDAGVSGDIADKVGNVIFKMSENTQVINITHLPQIASKGLNHFLVYKNEQSGIMLSNIKQLSKDERINEIARLLSGETLSEAAINNAKTLLGIH